MGCCGWYCLLIGVVGCPFGVVGSTDNGAERTADIADCRLIFVRTGSVILSFLILCLLLVAVYSPAVQSGGKSG